PRPNSRDGPTTRDRNQSARFGRAVSCGKDCRPVSSATLTSQKDCSVERRERGTQLIAARWPSPPPRRIAPGLASCIPTPYPQPASNPRHALPSPPRRPELFAPSPQSTYHPSLPPHTQLHGHKRRAPPCSQFSLPRKRRLMIALSVSASARSTTQDNMASPPAADTEQMQATALIG